MTSSSRSVPRKKRSTRKTALTPSELADCRALHRLYEATKEQTSAPLNFATISQAIGINRNTIGNYMRGERRIPETAMNAFAVYFRRRPQDIFSNYPWPTLVQVAPDQRIPWLALALSGLLATERDEFVAAVALALRATRHQRRRIIAAIREIVPHEVHEPVTEEILRRSEG